MYEQYLRNRRRASNRVAGLENETTDALGRKRGSVDDLGTKNDGLDVMQEKTSADFVIKGGDSKA